MSQAGHGVTDAGKAHECVTEKNVGIVEEEEEGVMSKVKKKERQECRNCDSFVRECFPLANSVCLNWPISFGHLLLNAV